MCEYGYEPALTLEALPASAYTLAMIGDDALVPPTSNHVACEEHGDARVRIGDGGDVRNRTARATRIRLPGRLRLVARYSRCRRRSTRVSVQPRVPPPRVSDVPPTAVR